MSDNKGISKLDDSVNGKMGFIPLLRKPFRENRILRSGVHDILALLLFLIFEAAPREQSIYLGTTEYFRKRGMVVRSKVSLASVFKCNRKTIDRMLARLAALGEISIETRTFSEYKKVSIFKVLRYDRYVWDAGAKFQDMKALVELGGYLAIDREHILSMKLIKKKGLQCMGPIYLFVRSCLSFSCKTEGERCNDEF